MTEFKHGDVVTYCHGDSMARGVVIDIHYEAGQVRYLLMEEPEGKPISEHKQVDVHPADIMQSRYFKGEKPAKVFHYDKATHQLRHHR